MAWRIHEQVLRAEIDNRTRGIITGTIWLAGRSAPLRLNLEGNAWPDMAGCLLTVENPEARPDPLEGLAEEQRGVAGDFTASRRVRIPTVPLHEWLESHPRGPLPSVWGNSVYLEWYSERNGRVVIELAGCPATLSEPAWKLTESEHLDQARCARQARDAFLRRLGEAVLEESGELADGEPRSPGPDRRTAGGSGLEVGDPAASAHGVDIAADPGGSRDRAPEATWSEIEALSSSDRLAGVAPLPDPVEECECRPLRELLAEDGFIPVRPEALRDDEIETPLWQLLGALARRNIFLHATDHLSDRELYSLLVTEILEEEHEDLPGDSGWISHLCLCDYGSSDDPQGMQTFLRHYADDAMRRRWADDFPDDLLPCRTPPPYDRDRWLPQPRF